jgi:HSP20 family protein
MRQNGTQALDPIRETAPTTPTAPTSRAVTVTPRADVLETDDEFLLLADMPGVTADNLDVRFENGELTLHGRRPAEHGDGRTRALWEYEVTNYFRTFRLTDHIAADRIEAEMKNGVLTLHLPKAEAVKPRRIAVKG